MISLLVEGIFIQRDITAINTKINSIVKNNELQLQARLRRQATTSPKVVYDSLVKKQRSVRQEVSVLQSAIEIKALSPLVTISQIAASSQGATLIEFKSSDTGEVTAVFSAESVDELNNLKSVFERSQLSEIQATIDESKLHLTINAIGN
jgi:hypothetical protein